MGKVSLSKQLTWSAMCGRIQNRPFTLNFNSEALGQPIFWEFCSSQPKLEDFTADINETMS